MMSLPYSHNHPFPTPLPPPAQPKSQSEPIQLPPFEPIKEVAHELDKQNDKLSNSEMVKTYFESKTHHLLIDHQKSNLDLFKIIHSALVSIESKIETLASSVGDLCKVTTQLNQEITKMNQLTDEMNKTLDDLKKKPIPSSSPVTKTSSIQRSPSMIGKPPIKK